MWRCGAHLLCSFEPQFSKFWTHHFYLARYEIRWMPTLYVDMTKRTNERASKQESERKRERERERDREGQKGRVEIIYFGKLLLNEIRRCDSCKSKFQHPISVSVANTSAYHITHDTKYQLEILLTKRILCAFIHMNVSVAQSSDSCSVWVRDICIK